MFLKFFFKRHILLSRLKTIPTSIGFSLLLRFPLVTKLTFCIIRKRDHKKILKLISCRFHHLVDMLVEFCQNHLFVTLKMAERAIPVNIYQFLHQLVRTRACGEKFAKNPSAYLNHLKIHGYTTNMFYQQTCQCVCSNAVMSDDMIFGKLHVSKITVPYIM